MGQTPRSRSKGQIRRYPKKGLVTRNTQVKYESHSSSKSKVMGKVKVFVTDRLTDRQTDE